MSTTTKPSSLLGKFVYLKDTMSMRTTGGLSGYTALLKRLQTELKLDVEEVTFESGQLGSMLATQKATGLIFYSMDRCAIAFKDADYAALAAFAAAGGLVVTLGDDSSSVQSFDSDKDGTASDGLPHCTIPRYSATADSVGYLYLKSFGWENIRQDDSVYSGFGTKYPFVRDASVAGSSVFATTPPASVSGTVSYYWGLRSRTSDGASKVQGARALYRHAKTSLALTDRSAGVWTAPYGEGTVLYIGFNWRSSGWSGDKSGDDWTQVLKAGLTLAPAKIAEITTTKTTTTASSTTITTTSTTSTTLSSTTVTTVTTTTRTTKTSTTKTTTTVSSTTTTRTTKTSTSKTTTTVSSTTITTTSTTTLSSTTATTATTTTTIFDPGNVDCVEVQDDCTAACEVGANRNHRVITPTNKKGSACLGPIDCQPGVGACPTTTSTTSRTTTTSTTSRTTTTSTTSRTTTTLTTGTSTRRVKTTTTEKSITSTSSLSASPTTLAMTTPDLATVKTTSTEKPTTGTSSITASPTPAPTPAPTQTCDCGYFAAGQGCSKKGGGCGCAGTDYCNVGGSCKKMPGGKCPVGPTPPPPTSFVTVKTTTTETSITSTAEAVVVADVLRVELADDDGDVDASPTTAPTPAPTQTCDCGYFAAGQGCSKMGGGCGCAGTDYCNVGGSCKKMPGGKCPAGPTPPPTPATSTNATNLTLKSNTVVSSPTASRSAGKIVGGIFGVLALLCALIAFAYYYFRIRAAQGTVATPNAISNPVYEPYGSQPVTMPLQPTSFVAGGMRVRADSQC